jgi:MoxR-like ATPase
VTEATAGVDSDEQLNRAIRLAAELAANVEFVVHGKSEEIRLVLAAVIAGGHVLFEDMPGTAKTILARALAGSIGGATFSRIQCTPDLQPTDVTGLSIFDQRSREFEFRPGPVFANVLLVDEINRAMPKTQSALLEAMAEKQVTIEGVTRTLAEPFVVLATENPIEQEGTFPLPEAQLDRFSIKTMLGYPGLEDEVQIVTEQRVSHPLEALKPVIDVADLLALRSATELVYVDPLVLRWLVEVVRATRALDEVSVGASVRATLAIERTARAWALVHGRTYVDTADIEHLFVPVVAHRLVFDPFAVAVDEATAEEGTLLERVRRRVLELAPPPAPAWDGQQQSPSRLR